MRTLLFLFIISIGLFANAQVKMPVEVAKRLQKDKSFSSYAREMTRYIKTNQSKYPDSSRERKFYNKQEKYLARSLWYLEGRQNGDGTIRNYSKQTYEAIQRYQSQIAPNVSATGAWSLVGPNNNIMGSENTTGIGRADRIAFHPTNPNTIFVGTPAAGIFKSVNGGDSWTNLNSFIPSLGISGLVISWSDPDVIYALTGDGDSNIENGFVQGFDYIRPSIGVLKSSDGGNSWQQTGTLYNTDSFFVGYKLVQDPANANILLAATSRGLYRTTNGGNTWTRVSNAENRFYDIEWKPGSSTRVYAASADTFYISNDAGASFVNQNNNLNIPWDSCTRIALSVSPANPNSLYLMACFVNYQYTNVNKGVFRSTNSGDNLFQMTNNPVLFTDGLPQYMFNITTASNNASIVLIGSLNIRVSTNGATTFTGSNNSNDATSPKYVHVDIHDLAYNPLDNALYVASDGGVYKSTDHGDTYAAKYVGFTASQFYHFDISTANDDYMFAGAQDNGGMLRQGNSVVFSKMISGDGYDTKFDNGSTTLAWISVNSSVYRSNATMTSFTSEGGLGGGWFKRIAMSYSNSNFVFISSGPVYRTLSAGGSWSDRGANGRWALTTCPSNGNRLYAAGGASWNADEDDDGISDKRFYRSDDLADSWVELTNKPGMPATITKITSIEVSPSNSSQVWITMGGFTDEQKVYYSSDAGNNWTNISGSIPNFPVNCIAIDANEDAYIGTDAGVFYKSISMNDWQPFFNSLPQAPVTELHIRNGNIYASTFGRGIWVSDTRGPCPANINFTSQVSGIKFYEAITFTASSTLRGGAGNQLFLRAQSNIVLSPGFRADGSTGEKFRAWIGNCGSGGIPQFQNGEITEWMNTHRNDQLTLNNTNDSAMISINMPFDGKARLFLLDKEQQIKEVLLADKSLHSGKSSLHIGDKIDWANRTVVLMIDGKMAGVIKQKSK